MRSAPVLESQAIRSVRQSESRFAAYVETLASALGNADRVAPLTVYCIGPLLPGERKSVEPMAAARVEPGRVQAAHQSLPLRGENGLVG